MESAPAATRPPRPPEPGWVRRDGFAGCYLGLFVAGEAAYSLLNPAARASFLAFASTSVASLRHDPLGCLGASAFLTGGDLASAVPWLPLIAIALLGASRAAGPGRAIAVTVAGHVAGTLVSEGAVAWRVHAGALPDRYRHLTDVGPSYVVASALVLAIGALPWSRRDRRAWTWRVLAVGALALLIYPGRIFSGLASGDVAAVGHVTAIATAVVLASFFARRRARQPTAAPPTASPIR